VKCANCNRHVRDENAIGRYGQTCAKRLGIVAVKPAREKKQRKKVMSVNLTSLRRIKFDDATLDLFEGVI